MGYVAYYRVSTKKQGDSGLGLDSQREIIRHFYSDIVAEYTEVQSAKNTSKRPILEQAIAECVANGHTLVVAKVDRLSRKTEDALEIFSRLNQRLASCDIPAMDKFTLTLYMAIADRERELIGIRTKGAMKQAKKRGVVMGTPENLTEEAQQKSVVVNIDKAKEEYRTVYGYAELMRSVAVNGRRTTFAAIADKLNSEGHTTRNGKQFTPMTVKRILDRGKV